MKGLKIFIIGILLCAAVYIGIFIGRTTQSNTLHLSGAQQDKPEIQYIDLNTATMDDLQTLPGVGPGLAREIIEYREKYGDYVLISELLDIKGMTRQIYNEIKAYIRIH